MKSRGKGIFTLALALLPWWGILAQSEVKTFSDSSLLRLSRTVYFKSSLAEWGTFLEVAQNCVQSEEGPLLLNHALDGKKIKSALEALKAPGLRVLDLPAAEILDELLFLWRLDLYQNTRPSKRELKFRPSCLKKYSFSLVSAQRLSRLELILRERVGVEDAPKVRLPLRARQRELITSLRETLESQYSVEWLLAP